MDYIFATLFLCNPDTIISLKTKSICCLGLILDADPSNVLAKDILKEVEESQWQLFIKIATVNSWSNDSKVISFTEDDWEAIDALQLKVDCTTFVGSATICTSYVSFSNDFPANKDTKTSFLHDDTTPTVHTLITLESNKDTPSCSVDNNNTANDSIQGNDQYTHKDNNIGANNPHHNNKDNSNTDVDDD